MNKMFCFIGLYNNENKYKLVLPSIHLKKKNLWYENQILQSNYTH